MGPRTVCELEGVHGNTEGGTGEGGASAKPDTTVVVFGRRHRLEEAPLVAQLGISEETWAAMLSATKPGDAGASTTTWAGSRRVVVGVLPEVCSRHNSPSRAWAIPAIAKQAKGDADAVVVALVSGVGS